MNAPAIARRADSAPQPFHSTAAALFWALQFLAARRDGAGAAFGTGGRRPCEPDDIVKCLDRLYRQKRITLAHARVLRIYGERGAAPDASIAKERGDMRLWNEALAAMNPALTGRGIVSSRADKVIAFSGGRGR